MGDSLEFGNRFWGETLKNRAGPRRESLGTFLRFGLSVGNQGLEKRWKLPHY